LYYIAICKGITLSATSGNCSCAVVSHRQNRHTLSLRPSDFEPITKQPYAALVCRLIISTPLIRNMDYCSFTNPEGMKAELTWLVDPQPTLYQSGHMSTIDQAKITESLPAKDRRPNRQPTKCGDRQYRVTHWSGNL